MAVLLLPLMGSAPPPDSVALEIEVTGLRSSNGFIQACVWHGPEYYMKQRCEGFGREVIVPAAPTVSMKIELQPGEYAVSLIHDANGNHKLDKNLFGMPTEGFGFSRNPAIAFSQPSYAATRFEADAAPVQLIRVKYFL